MGPSTDARRREDTTIRRRRVGVWWGLAVLLGSAAPSAPAAVELSHFPRTGLEGWEHRSFEGETRYGITERNGAAVLEAEACGTASGLYRDADVDLGATPVLGWRWWIDAPIDGPDPTTRAGDDFAARVYVVFSGGLAFWRTTAIVYVWAEADAPTEPWRNPFTDQAGMIVVERGAPGGDGLREARRNVARDYRTVFGQEPPPVRAVAVMTDSDQTGACARARYAQLRFLPAGPSAGP